jgi:squalene-hopene/tetraprenyl-beta-curcumene cyclase
MAFDKQAFQRARENTRARLLSSFNPGGYWRGRLSSSALSTATATIALALVDRTAHDRLIRDGLDWLAEHINPDGGWGDTVRSRSNINTTSLCWSALAFAPEEKESWSRAAARGGDWIRRHASGDQAGTIAKTILKFYGADRTFSTPVLTLLILSGRLGPRREAFGNIPCLPFELAATPHELWRSLGLPVVSYAIPALVAIGQTHHHHRPTRNPVRRAVRNAVRERTLKTVLGMQPRSGGFLEAIPLTSFVCACLASMGKSDHPIVRNAVRFLVGQVREDHAWPIDTCLSTWLTSLSIHALSLGGGLDTHLPLAARRSVQTWLLGQQYDHVHPFTHTPPGGWSWMDTDGAVPDADDTPGAILALAALAPEDPAALAAIERGAVWLLKLQNRDGGMPTFCRGWGKLPFDRSAADITAHSLRAWHRALPLLTPDVAGQVDKASKRLAHYLRKTQSADGSWLPLWFGNQSGPDDANPCYGTARVVMGLAEAGYATEAMTIKGLRWLLDTRQAEGGWSGGTDPASIEETGVVVEALATWFRHAGGGHPLAAEVRGAALEGVASLIRQTREGTEFPGAPIGLYFAKLWYYEDHYPVVFALSAMEMMVAAGLVEE